MEGIQEFDDPLLLPLFVQLRFMIVITSRQLNNEAGEMRVRHRCSQIIITKALNSALFIQVSLLYALGFKESIASSRHNLVVSKST